MRELLMYLLSRRESFQDRHRVDQILARTATSSHEPVSLRLAAATAATHWIQFEPQLRRDGVSFLPCRGLEGVMYGEQVRFALAELLIACREDTDVCNVLTSSVLRTNIVPIREHLARVLMQYPSLKDSVRMAVRWAPRLGGDAYTDINALLDEEASLMSVGPKLTLLSSKLPHSTEDEARKILGVLLAAAKNAPDPWVQEYVSQVVREYAPRMTDEFMGFYLVDTAALAPSSVRSELLMEILRNAPWRLVKASALVQLLGNIDQNWRTDILQRIEAEGLDTDPILAPIIANRRSSD